jgi:hypothetical protein
MKQKIYILGVITVITVFAGAIFKVNHYPGAGVMITTGLASLVLLFLPLALVNHYRSEEGGKNLSLYIVTYITCFVVFTAMLFKLMHWPYAGVLLTIALPFPYVIFLPVFVAVTSKEKNFNIYSTVFVLLLLALNSVFSALLSLNVTSNRVEDSYRLSGNYNRQEMMLENLPAADPGSAINTKIDDLLKIVNDCQTIILKLDSKTEEQWELNPGNILRPDFRGSAATSLKDTGELYAEKLGKGLKELIGLMAVTPGYEAMAKNAPAVFNYYNASTSDESEWSKEVFNDFLAWVLIYLDGLEANLLTIKASDPS